MKILHINSYYSTSSFYKNMYEYQISNGLEIDVFVPVTTSFKKRDFNYGQYTTISKNHSRYDRLIFHLKHHKIYKDICSNYNIKDFSMLHAHSLFSNGYIAMNIKKNYGIPYIVAVRNTDVNIFFKKMLYLRKLGVQILKNADRIIFLAESYRDAVIEQYIPDNLKEDVIKKTSVIPNGIDDFWRDNIGVPKRKPENREWNILQVGDINKNKNIITTAKAIKLLNEKGYTTRLDIAGKIKDEKIYKCIKDFENISYLGVLPKEELIDVFRRNDIFVLPSITESFGLVYAEAMSQGLPIIYSRGQGFDGQFKEGLVGFSVDCFDEVEIANKIIEAINMYEIISDNCIKSSEKFSWNNISMSYIDLYRNLYSLES